MKKIFLFLFVFTTNRLFAQSDLKKADSLILVQINELLSTPFSKDNPERLKSTAKVINWMAATSDYTFSLDQPILNKITKGNDNLLGLYMICMAKYSLTNNVNAKDQKLVALNAVKILLDYAANETYQVPITNTIKKLMVANRKGNLAHELGI